jgi:hypothetical protein
VDEWVFLIGLDLNLNLKIDLFRFLAQYSSIPRRFMQILNRAGNENLFGSGSSGLGNDMSFLCGELNFSMDRFYRGIKCEIITSEYLK